MSQAAASGSQLDAIRSGYAFTGPALDLGAAVEDETEAGLLNVVEPQHL